MCELLAAELGGRAEVSRAEEEVGTGFTVDVLRRLRAERPDDRFALVVGADVLRDAPAWREFETVKTLARLVVLGRGGYGSGGSAVTLPEVSSSDVRERIARGESVDGLVPRAVLAYLRERRLYAR
jgi:nicotinate-nucleotide adenylyltransferase